MTHTEPRDMDLERELVEQNSPDVYPTTDEETDWDARHAEAQCTGEVFEGEPEVGAL